MVMTERCTRRVWDNGDCTNCDDPVVVADRCRRHADTEIEVLKAKFIELTADLQKTNARLVELGGSF